MCHVLGVSASDDDDSTLIISNGSDWNNNGQIENNNPINSTACEANNNSLYNKNGNDHINSSIDLFKSITLETLPRSTRNNNNGDILFQSINEFTSTSNIANLLLPQNAIVADNSSQPITEVEQNILAALDKIREASFRKVKFTTTI